MATRAWLMARDRRGRPRFARLAASPLPRACIALTKSEEKERLLAVYVPKTLQWIKTTQFYLLGFLFTSRNNSIFNIIVLFFFFRRGWLVLVLRLLWHLKYFNFCAQINTFSFLEISIIWRSGRTNNKWQELHPPSPRPPLECTWHAAFPYIAKELYLDICHLQLFFLKNQR